MTKQDKINELNSLKDKFKYVMMTTCDNCGCGHPYENPLGASHDELLEALKKVFIMIEFGSISDSGNDFEFIKKAIAKAEGKG
jgi:hypothetical protein